MTKQAIIDAGITPYPYPKAVCRLIAAWDFLTVSLAALAFFCRLDYAE